MTREEAIDIMQGALLALLLDGKGDTEEAQMVEMAIEALKAQDRPIICPRCGREFAESEGREE